MSETLLQQLAFVREAEKLKVILRRNRVVDGSRYENAAEHSWHVALMATVLMEHADANGLDRLRVLEMLLVHDLVEVDAGDTWLYSEVDRIDQLRAEREAAERLFGLLPSPDGRRLRELWEEFEARTTPEAQYAAAIDALQPLLNHLMSGSPSDEACKPHVEEVLAKKMHIRDASRPLWDAAVAIIEESSRRGLYFRSDEAGSA